jgi:hypothetical protein
LNPLFVLAALALTPTLASGHGGVYVPPPDVPTQKSGIPDPSKPPGFGGSPVLGGPNSGGPGPSNPLTPGGFAAVGPDTTRWTWWWEFHRAPYLELRRHVLGADPLSGGGDFLGQGSNAGFALVPTPARIRGEVVPALVRVLKGEGNPDLLSSALIALARVCDDLEEDDRRDAAGHIRPFLRDGSRELAEAATLALGILGHEPSAPLLAALARDDSFARSILHKSEVPARTRAFAAYALGLLAGESRREDVRRYAIHELARILESDRDSPQGDLAAACILAFGLVPLEPAAGADDSSGDAPPSAGRAAQIAFLTEILADRRRSDFARAQVPLSIARLAAAPAAPAAAAGEADARLAELRRASAKLLLDRLAPMRREPNGVVQSSVVGLGLLVDDDDDSFDVEARRTLRTIDSDQRDRGARRFARIALARSAARSGSGPADGTADVRRFLLAELAKGSSDERAWAALALGVLERGRIDAGELPERSVAAALRAALGSAKAPDEVGSCAIALGLLRDPDAEGELLARLRDVRDDEARGQVALALGMIGARATTAELQRLVDGSAYRPLTLREAASGLALLGDKSTLPRLLAQLKDSRSLASQAALAQAIGLVGDARGFADLAELIADESISAGARAFAVVALGLSADLDPLPWSVPLALHGNHLTAPVTLYDDLGLGVLNLL